MKSWSPDRITSLIPHVKLAVMENRGYWPQYEDTETFDRIHLDFSPRPLRSAGGKRIPR